MPWSPVELHHRSIGAARSMFCMWLAQCVVTTFVLGWSTMDIYESSFSFDDDDCGEEGVSAVLVGSAGASELIQRALALSRARVWREASAEWAVIGASDREYPDGTCECGQPNIRYEYVVGNGVTGAAIDPVGSSCV